MVMVGGGEGKRRKTKGEKDGGNARKKVGSRGNDIKEQWKRMGHTIQMCKMDFTSALKQEP